MRKKSKKTFLSKLNKSLKLFYLGLEVPFTPSKKSIKQQKKNLKISLEDNYWVKDIMRTNQIVKKYYKRPELCINNLELISVFKFKSRDGLNLSGMVYEPNPNSNKWVIACHWFSAHKNWALHHSIIFTKMGYNVMVFDFRGHGYSQDDSTTMGSKEHNDLMGAVDWLKENRTIESLALMGTSMGAFTVNSVSLKYREELRKLNLKFVVSDATYGSVFSLFVHVRNIYLKFLSKKRTKKAVIKLIDRHNSSESQLNLYDTSLFKLVQENNQKPLFPTLFFHSLDDKVTPPSDTYELIIKRNNSEDDYIMFNYSMHTQSMRLHFKTMNYKIAEFIFKFDENKEELENIIKEWNLQHFDKRDQDSLKLK